MSAPIASKMEESEKEFKALQAMADTSNASTSGVGTASEAAPVGPVQVDKHCASLWFDDGNIVLSAPSEVTANLTVHFCVHAGVLRRHSQVFADMLAIPAGHRNSSSEGENYGGLPRVRMTDSSEDLEAFLKVLYDPWAFSTKKRVTATLSRTKGFLTLADKYNLHGMKGFVQNTLEAEWPRSLEHWDLMDNRRSTMQIEGIMMSSDLFPEPAAAVRLAKQYQIKTVLPAALYHLSRSDREKKGAPAAAGGAGTQTPRGSAAKSGDARARWDLVPLDTLAALYKVREVTEEVGVALYDAFVSRKASAGAFAGCVMVGCPFLDKATARFEDLGRNLANRRDVLKTLRILKVTIKKDLVGFRCNRQQPCGYDAAKIIEKLDSMRLEIWAKLEECSA